jgi:hypothetical protein
VVLPYRRAALRGTAISFGAYCLKSAAAFSTASASVAASTSPIHVCLAGLRCMPASIRQSKQG